MIRLGGERTWRLGRFEVGQLHIIRTSRHYWSIGPFLLFIAAVSVHDVALVVLNRDVILDFERNPIGRWLIEVNQGDVWLFAGVKLFLTSLVCALLVSLFEYSRRLGWVTAGGLTAFQAGLLYYLCSS